MVSSGLLRRVALVFLRSRLLVAACVVPSSPIFVTLMKEAPGSSETSVLTRATRRHNPEHTILCCEWLQWGRRRISSRPSVSVGAEPVDPATGKPQYRRQE
jgi:hypothetical protein